MRVICIRGTKIGEKKITQTGTGNFFVSQIDHIIEGEIYTVVETRSWPEYDAYTLKERAYKYSYDVSRFAPLSEIDETEMIREFKTELL